MADDLDKTLLGRAKQAVVQRGTEHFGMIPKERLAVKLKRSLVGLLFVGVGFGVTKSVPDAPWWAKAGPTFLGALIVSGDLGKKAILFAVGVVKDVLSAKKDAT